MIAPHAANRLDGPPLPNDVSDRDDRLSQLRGDLAALRQRTAREFGIPPHPITAAPVADPAGRGGDADTTAGATAGSTAGSDVEAEEDADAGRTAAAVPTAPAAEGGAAGGPSERRPRRPARPRGRRRAPRPPRPPRPTLRERAARRRPRPPRRLQVPPPVPVPRRPSFVAAPRWPVWTPQRAAVAIAIGVPAILQLGDRLVQAMSTTSVLLGADPSRPDYLRAAAGVAGGGLTLALAVVALAVVRGRPGFLAAAVGVLAAFCVLPWMAYTATAGIVTASLPPLGAAIRPDGWGGAWLTWTFWLCAAAAAAAVTDLAIRAGLALRTAAAGD